MGCVLAMYVQICESTRARFSLTLKTKITMRVIIEPNDSAKKRMLAEALKENGLAEVELESVDPTSLSVEERFLKALLTLQEEGLIKHKYDYAWLLAAINRGIVEDMSKFISVKSFIDYVKGLGIAGVAGNSTLALYLGYVNGRFPDWCFSDKCDNREKIRRINLINRFLNLFRSY